MTVKSLASALTVILGATSGLAQAQTDIPAPPPLTSYIATSPPRPNAFERAKDAVSLEGPTGIYVAAIVGKSSLNISNIKRTGFVDPNAFPIDAVKNSADGSATMYGAAIGYKIPFLKIPSRIEVEYIYHQPLDYNSAPVITNFLDFQNLAPINIDSTFRSQSAMANLYYDLDLGYRLVPYIGGGAGAAFNTIKGTVIDTAGSELLTFNNSSTNFAWNLRAGARFFITPSAIIDGGYYYEPLQNKVIWPLPDVLPGLGETQQLESDTVYASDFYLRFTWQFS